MAKSKKRGFATVEQIFEKYVPKYTPPSAYGSREKKDKQEIGGDTEFTANLIKQFEKDLS